MVNVGDQQGNRRKWIHLFETVNVVLFFASLVDFIEPSTVPQLQTKLDESLEYFRFVLDSLPLSRKDAILFLTKKDILSAILAAGNTNTPISHPELRGVTDPKLCITNQQKLFLSKCTDRGQKSGRVFSHTVCLLDIDEMKGTTRTALKDVLDANFRRHAMF
ncbi:unnamed protein product [Mesocestoides corti]|uniref:Uncharacterized protein n=1 Tax=Mesocestoides corti TaxID=53468 RepID=A0A3P6HEH0_MESCO|nr:unnamed protein product [Mesocestoides corti]